MVVTMANAAVVGKEETHKHMRLSSDVTERSRCCVSPSIHLHRMRSSRTMSSIAALLKRKEKGKKNNTAAKPRKESACVARALGFSLGGGGRLQSHVVDALTLGLGLSTWPAHAAASSRPPASLNDEHGDCVTGCACRNKHTHQYWHVIHSHDANPTKRKHLLPMR